MSECRFYEIRGGSLERILADMLEKSRQRGWRVLVRAGSQERMLALNAALWTWRDDSFLPHGCRRDGDPQDQPIYLTEARTESANPNGADVLMLTDASVAEDWRDWQRCVCLLDGLDAEQRAAAESWRDRVIADGGTTLWWRQGKSGWEQITAPAGEQKSQETGKVRGAGEKGERREVQGAEEAREKEEAQRAGEVRGTGKYQKAEEVQRTGKAGEMQEAEETRETREAQGAGEAQRAKEAGEAA